MARKNLLTEAEVRSFMKLAELRPLADGKIDQLYGVAPDINEEDELERELDATEDELGAEDRVADDEADELDSMDMDMDMGMDADADAGGADMVSVDDFMGALETALEDVLGEPVSTEMDDEVDMDMDLDDDDGMDVGVEDEVDIALDAEDEEVPGMRDVYENQEALVHEVAQRVAARLQSLNDKDNMIEALAERIMKRLTK